MSRRKEKIREGLEIDYDLIDSDMMRWHIILDINWTDGPRPQLLWMEYGDEEDWTEDDDTDAKVMIRTLDNPVELAEGRRMLRLMRYKSYACLAELADRKPEKGEFVIRKPPRLGDPEYVTEIDEAIMPAGLGDPDRPEFADEDGGFWISDEIDDAQRFTHAEAIRLTIRIMEVLGYDIPGDHGDYWEPIRADIAEELHARAIQRPRLRDAFEAMKNDLSREP